MCQGLAKILQLPVRTARNKVHYDGRRYRCSKFMQHDFIMRSKMSVIKNKMGTIKSKIGRKFEQKKKSRMGKRKSKFSQGLYSGYPSCRQAEETVV